MGDAEAKLWSEVRDLFAEEDGSLPEVRLERLSPAGVQAAFEELISLTDSKDALERFKATIGGEEVKVSGIPDLGRQAAMDTAMHVHFVLPGVRVESTMLPDLGVGLHEGEVALDYYAGPQWDATTVAALIKLLERLRHAAGEGRLSAGDEVQDYSDEVTENFREAARHYLAQA